MKDEICRLVARGHSIEAVADIVGVSDRTVYRERKRDPFFKQRLGEKGAEIADLCFEAWRTAAPNKPSAATQLYKFVYPDRYYYRPETITRDQHDAWTEEVFGLFESIATPEQMRELQRELKGGRKRRRPRRMNG
jgi:IS30 family transposase